MDSSKAQKAKSTAKARKKQHAQPHLAGLERERQAKKSSPHINALARERHMREGSSARVTGNLTPEITAPQIALQTPTVNPYHMMGTMAPTYYNPGNVVGGGYNL